MDSGETIKCMEKEFSFGQMEGNMMGNILKTKNKALEPFTGQMEGST